MFENILASISKINCHFLENNLYFKMNFFYEDGRGGIVDGSGREAVAFIVDSSFRLTNLTNLHKYIKYKKVTIETEEPKGTDMQEDSAKKERLLLYNGNND
jgi:hypothetical protein